MFSMLLINREFEHCFSLIRKYRIEQNEINVQEELANKTIIAESHINIIQGGPLYKLNNGALRTNERTFNN